MRRHFLVASLAIDLAVASTNAAAASNCKMSQIADWPVRLERNHLVVDGAINGQKISVMLDTGAQRSLIPRSATERLGLARQKVRGIGCSVSAAKPRSRPSI